jgi:hypothetical protein
MKLMATLVAQSLGAVRKHIGIKLPPFKGNFSLAQNPLPADCLLTRKMTRDGSDLNSKKSW